MAVGFKILNQHPNVELAPGTNVFRNVWEISYEVTDGPAKGTHATVTVTDSDHNAEYVSKVIQDKIAHLHAIASL
jgi:hypothetical protein